MEYFPSDIRFQYIRHSTELPVFPYILGNSMDLKYLEHFLFGILLCRKLIDPILLGGFILDSIDSYGPERRLHYQ